MNWLKQFGTFCFLDSNQYTASQEILIGAGAVRSFASSDSDALQGFQRFGEEKKGWLFGHMAYELATSEKRHSTKKENYLHFPDLFFFEPEIVLRLRSGDLEIFADDPAAVFTSIDNMPAAQKETALPFTVTIENKITRDAYVEIINTLKSHIQRGDCYEINFCQEFFSKNVAADPFLLFKKLNRVSPNPFSGLYRMDDKWLLCASPERFIRKERDHIISQPIKGTLQRKWHNVDLKKEQQELLQSSKDKAENVMIVDLVRNDFAKICKEGSVKVDELFGIYSFPQVHQMISTISGTLKDHIHFADIINATFPMGSMTGAPKIRVMELIDRYEKSKRGLFSGSLGYISPSGDFDFNVVIRSIMYNAATRYLSFQTGSGITIYSDAEKEWEECMVKAKAIKEILGN